MFVVTGPSGAGKGTLVRALLDRFEDLELAVSATTRGRRPSERDGREYWFLTEAEFAARIDSGDFLEHVAFAGHRYGTLRSEVSRILGSGKWPVLELEIEGAMAVAQELEGAVTIFVTAPIQALEARLRERATESSGEIHERLAIARGQLEHAGEFEHVVENDDLARAIEDISAIVARKLDGAATMARP